MSYLVLARKWRPRRFSELVGQEHVVRALSHALDSGRVHHAFLFTGTRGVGKTTIARIFAKSLNCERGVGAEPCGSCPVCESVDAGRFVDLIEIDAASNTGVDDVREVIENAQYMPTRGRYKVYLVDEVHMLSRNAFNALLKTLEEPPEHVKFLLATTDPQKLPVTVLSRCLQFNLKRLTEEQILAQMQRILEAEGVAHESASLALLARAADGSLRDGLSLLDQAIAYGGGSLSRDDVAAMLGTVEARDIDGLLDALVREDGVDLLRVVEELASFSPDYASVLSDLASALHRVQLFQLVPEAVEGDVGDLLRSAGQRPAELIQLWYQMAVSGKREIELAPTPRIGFEMILLRMLAFIEAPTSSESAKDDQAAPRSGRAEANAAVARLQSTPAAHAPAVRTDDRPVRDERPAARSSVPAMPVAAQEPPTRAASAAPPTDPAGVLPTMRVGEPRRVLRDNEDWLAAVSALGLRGPAIALAQQLAFASDDGLIIRVSLPENQEHLRMPGLVEKFSEALAAHLGGALTLSFGKSVQQVETLQQRNDKQRDARQREAEQAFARHPVVEQLVRVHGGQIVPDSVQPRTR